MRDAEYQRYLYEEVPGSTTTPLIGPHGFRLAYDVVPLVNGDADWDSPQWNKIGRLGKSIGLEWAGDWKSFIEKAHFQYTQGLSGADLRAGKRPKFPVENKVSESEGFDIMPYDLQPIAKGKLKGTATLDCCSKPSNNASTGDKLRPIHAPFNIYAKCKSESREWYLVNVVNEQWVAAHYVQIIEEGK